MLVRRATGLAVQPALILLGVGLSISYATTPHSALSELFLYQSVVMVALVMAAYNFRRAAPERRVAGGLILAALAFFSVGKGIWWAYGTMGRDPYPSPAHYFFLLGCIALLALGIHLGRMSVRDLADRAHASIDALILTAGMATLVWKLLMEPNAMGIGISATERAVGLGFPTADIFVIGCVLHLFLVRRHVETWVLLLFVGLTTLFVGDVALAWTNLQGTYELGSWVDTFFPISYLLLAYSIRLSSAWGGSEQSWDAADNTSRPQFLAVAIASLVPLGLLAQELYQRGLLGINTMVVSTIGLMVVTGLYAWKSRRLLGKVKAMQERRGASRLSEIVHNSVDAILLLDADLKVTYASAALEQLIHVDPERCLGLDMGDLVDKSLRSTFEQHLRAVASSPDGAMIKFDSRIRVAGATPKHIEGSARNLLDNPDVGAVVVTVRDVSARRELEAQLERQAFHDSLTGLANRALFYDRVGHALMGHTRSAGVLPAVIFIDLDDFKSINDGMGHGAGDALLQQVAGRLLACLRPSDTVARLGGDEFAVLVEDRATIDDIVRVGSRILEVLRLPVQVGKLHLAIPASAGIAVAHASCNAESLMQEADIAMYSAKAQGKGRLVLFDHGLRETAENRLALKHDLPIALRNGEIHLEYQPIYEANKGTLLSGFEALVRWDHPTRGPLPPLDFIPLAEETGDIIELGSWILRTACAQAQEWNRRSDHALTMSVNVSAVQIHHPDFLIAISSTLADTGLPPSCLIVELTESTLADHEVVEPILRAVRALGVGVAIDDFGTGYSSLSYLQQLDVSSVKIDQSFVKALSSTQDLSLVRGILSIADALSLTVVAEGIENLEQLALLQDLDCTYVQGFYLSRPRLASDLDFEVDARAVHLSNF